MREDHIERAIRLLLIGRAQGACMTPCDCTCCQAKALLVAIERDRGEKIEAARRRMSGAGGRLRWTTQPDGSEWAEFGPWVFETTSFGAGWDVDAYHRVGVIPLWGEHNCDSPEAAKQAAEDALDGWLREIDEARAEEQAEEDGDA